MPDKYTDLATKLCACLTGHPFHPYALADALDLQLWPNVEGRSGLTGRNLEYPTEVSSAIKNKIVLRECARAILIRHRQCADDASANQLAAEISACVSPAAPLLAYDPAAALRLALGALLPGRDTGTR